MQVQQLLKIEGHLHRWSLVVKFYNTAISNHIISDISNQDRYAQFLDTNI